MDYQETEAACYDSPEPVDERFVEQFQANWDRVVDGVLTQAVALLSSEYGINARRLD